MWRPSDMKQHTTILFTTKFTQIQFGKILGTVQFRILSLLVYDAKTERLQYTKAGRGGAVG
jgi:hypothetical protein